MAHILLEASVFLLAALIAVPISKRLGLGSVLGYLLAGIAIGPVIGIVGEEATDIQHIAEFGVVMMLFLVGLELEPKKLWELRNKLLGLGGLQLTFTTLALFAVGVVLGLDYSIALTIALVLSLSSTAIVLQTLNEKGLLRTQGGQSSFSVLLFQDIAVIPMLALLPLLAVPELASNIAEADSHHIDILAGLSPWLKSLATFGAVGFIILGGRFIVPKAFNVIALSRLREMFTVMALFIVIGISALMSMIGLSPALGTFLAGVVLANSEYRHELESNIEPFKGLLLGVFFITVGANINVELLTSQFSLIAALTIGVIAIKSYVLFILGNIFKLHGIDHWLFALGLAQAGEFGFVLLSFTTQHAILPQGLADQLLLVIALSMLISPLLFILLDKFIIPAQETDEEQAMEAIDATENIILAGNGRFGQMIYRLLVNCGYQPTVIDLNVELVEGFSKRGYKTFFGDASRPELLMSAGIESAHVLIIAIDDSERAIDIVKRAKQLNPDIKLIVRAFDRLHCYDLYQAGARDIVRETFDSSIRAGKLTLQALGFDEDLSEEITQLYYHRDRQGVKEMADLYDPSLPKFGNEKMAEAAKVFNQETTELIDQIMQSYSKP